MTWVVITALTCWLVAYHLRCKAQEEYIERLADERDQALAGYDCLAEQYEDLLEARQYENVVEDDELQDALIEDDEVARLEAWFNLPAVEME
jgi:oligoendopeptidase F